MMVGWRFWLLVAVAVGFLVWATSALMSVDDESPAFFRADVSGSAAPEAEQIRDESRAAMREILRGAEGGEGRPR
jgi:hypothetical protein